MNDEFSQIIKNQKVEIYDDIALLIETIYNVNTTTEYKVILKSELRDLQKELISIKKEQKDYMTEILGEIEENSQKTYD